MKEKITVVIGELNVGGAERHLLSVLPVLIKDGWKMEIVTSTWGGVLIPEFRSQGVPVIELLRPWQIKLIEKIPGILKRVFRLSFITIAFVKKIRLEKPAIIHFFLPEAYCFGMIAALLARFSGITIMSRRSMNYYQQRRKILGFVERRIYKKTSIITGNSMAVNAQLKEEGILEEKIKLIYNGVDLKMFNHLSPREEKRQSLGISNNCLVMIMIANLIPYKGHQDLLEALNSIKPDLSFDWKLVCVGRDTGIGASLILETQKLRLTDHVLWLGGRSDIPDLLNMADIGILCSHEEGFSNAVIESMAAGLPMVVTRVGGNAEAVLDGETGYVVKKKDPVALSKAILDLALNREKAEEFGRLAKIRAKEYFSLESCVENYKKLYQEALKKHES